MSVRQWVATGMQAESVSYWASAHVVKFVLEGIVAAWLGGITAALVFLATAVTSPALPQALAQTFGVPVGAVTPIALWLLFSFVILSRFM